MRASAVVLMGLAMMAAGGAARALAGDFATDSLRGYALGGHDPVAYFTQRMAVEGSENHELSWGGTRWVFRNQGNRAAFEKAPLVYAPAFAGCDPYALADGFTVTGNPVLFALHRNRLLLFHSDINRFLFLADPKNLWDMASGNAARLGCEP